MPESQAENLLRKKIILLGQQTAVARNDLSIVQAEIKRREAFSAELDIQMYDKANEIVCLGLEKKSLLDDLGDIKRCSARQTAELIRNKAMSDELLAKNDKQKNEITLKEKLIQENCSLLKTLKQEKGLLENEISLLSKQVKRLSATAQRIQIGVDTLEKRYTEVDEAIPKRKLEGVREVLGAKEDTLKELADREGDISFKENNLKEKEEKLRGMIREAEKFYNRKFPNIFPNI